MFFTVRRRLLGARLGLLAFVLIAFAPLASQLSADTRDWSWLAELACNDGGEQAGMPSLETPKAFSLDACAYCSLLINSPALVGLGWGQLDLPVWHALPQPMPGQPVLRLRFFSAWSRAPPELG